MQIMKNRKILVTLECFVKKGNKYLMLHRSPDKKIMPNVWMAPGGKREFNEGLFECARREIKEETGLAIRNLRVKVTGNAYLKDLDTEIYFHFVFADYLSGEVTQFAKDGELIWLTPVEIGKLDNLLSEIHELVPNLFKEDGRVISYKAVYEKGNKMTEFHLEKS